MKDNRLSAMCLKAFLFLMTCALFWCLGQPTWTMKLEDITISCFSSTNPWKNCSTYKVRKKKSFFFSYGLICACCWVPKNTCQLLFTLLRETQNSFTVALGVISGPPIKISVIFFSKQKKPPPLANDFVMMGVVLLKFVFTRSRIRSVFKFAINVSSVRRLSSVLLHCQHGCQDHHLVMLSTLLLYWWFHVMN